MVVFDSAGAMRVAGLHLPTQPAVSPLHSRSFSLRLALSARVVTTMCAAIMKCAAGRNNGWLVPNSNALPSSRICTSYQSLFNLQSFDQIPAFNLYLTSPQPLQGYTTSS